MSSKWAPRKEEKTNSNLAIEGTGKERVSCKARAPAGSEKVLLDKNQHVKGGSTSKDI